MDSKSYYLFYRCRYVAVGTCRGLDQIPAPSDVYLSTHVKRYLIPIQIEFLSLVIMLVKYLTYESLVIMQDKHLKLGLKSPKILRQRLS